ncbi:MAG TPA: TonB-dependent receptor [Pyrinomonadaceae bacterium]|nr:TonB-dependent receptor [Pyrinomonadaceae bacterium]
MMKKLFFGFVFLIFGAGFSLAQGTATVSGTVSLTDSSVLHDAQVHLMQLKRTVQTGDDGTYKFDNVPPGRYTLLVHMEGFQDSSKAIEVTAGADLKFDFQLAIASIKEQVTVTASGTEQSVFESFQSVNSVGSTKITERAATSLGEVLESETGVAKRSFGPGSSRPVIRGFDGDRVLVLQDGVRSGSVGSQSGDHGETVDALSAERIEVVKGPGTLLYGSNALGGVVNVIGHHEDEAHDGVRGFFTGVGGTADKQAGGSGGLEYGFNKWLIRGNASAQRTGDFDTPIGVIPNSATRSNSLSLGGGYYGTKAYVGGTYGYDVRRYGIPFAALFEEPATELGELPTVDEDIDIRARRHNARIAGGFRDLTNNFISGIQYNFDYTDYRHKEIERVDDIDNVGTTFDNKTFSYRSLFEQAKRGSLTGRFGFEGFSRDYEVNGEEQLIQGKIDHNSFSAFGLEELNFDRVKFQFGGRVEHNSYNPENGDLRDRSFTGFSGGGGVNVSLWKGGAFIANYTHSFRSPALEELYNNGPHIGNITFEIGNPDLVTERSNGLDFSLRHQSNRIKLTADTYYYRIDNFVFLNYQDVDGDGRVDTMDGLPVARYEQANASYFGAEFNGEATFNQYVVGLLSLDYVRAKLVDEGIDLPRIPPFRARLGLDLRYKNLSVRPEAVFVSDQDKVAPLETPTAGYGIVNVAASYTIGGQHAAHIFTVNAYNLTDRLYRNHVSFIKDLVPEIGRGVRFGYTVRFF